MELKNKIRKDYLINNKYLLKELMYKNQRTEVWYCINIDNKKSFVIKFSENLDVMNVPISDLKKIECDNLVNIYDYGRYNAVSYELMENIIGPNLTGLIFSDLDLDHKIEICISIIEGVLCLHNNKILHCDIKPANIIYDIQKKIIKIIDFDCVARVNTRAKIVCGTEFYSPPEQVKNQILDERSDIYALGVLFYSFLSGINASIFTKYITKISAPKKISTLKKDVHEKVSDTINRMLEYEVKDRPRDLIEVLSVFEEFKNTKNKIKDIDLVKALSQNSINRIEDIESVTPTNPPDSLNRTRYFSQRSENQTDANNDNLFADIRSSSFRHLQKDVTNNTSFVKKDNPPTSVEIYTNNTPLLISNTFNSNHENGIIKFNFDTSPTTVGLSLFFSIFTDTYSNIYRFLTIDILPSSEISLPEEVFPTLKTAKFNSPGFFEFISSLNPLSVLLTFIEKINQIKKDNKFNNILEAQSKMLDNMQKENDVIEKRLEVYKNMGFSDNEIRLILYNQVLKPSLKLHNELLKLNINHVELVEDKNK